MLKTSAILALSLLAVPAALPAAQKARSLQEWASYYRTQAERYQAEARAHEQPSGNPAGSPADEAKRPLAPGTAAHRRLFADHAVRAATHARALALIHEQMARNAG